jgi:hypothetical protein
MKSLNEEAPHLHTYPFADVVYHIRLGQRIRCG